MTTCFVVSYVPFVVSVTFVANSVLEVAGRSGVAAAAAAAGHAGQRHHQVLVDVMSPVALAALALFWTLLGVAFYRYAEGCATATPAAAAAPVDNKQPQQTAVVVAAAAAKRECPENSEGPRVPIIPPPRHTAIGLRSSVFGSFFFFSHPHPRVFFVRDGRDRRVCARACVHDARASVGGLCVRQGCLKIAAPRDRRKFVRVCQVDARVVRKGF